MSLAATVGSCRRIPSLFGNTALITGANGRVGRLLRHQWRDHAKPDGGLVWQARNPLHKSDMAWDFGADLPAAWPRGAVILHLAGATAGSPDHLAVNPVLAMALARAAVAGRAAHVIFASTAAVYHPGPEPLTEDALPDGRSPYGQSKRAAELALAQGLAGSGIGLTCLRIGNIAGADALLGGAGQAAVVLDPVPGQVAGPERSYIGPQALARALAALITRAPDLPPVLNLAQPGLVAMGDLLDAAGLTWHFGPPRAAVLPRVHLETTRIQSLIPLKTATADSLVRDLRGLEGAWP